MAGSKKQSMHDRLRSDAQEALSALTSDKSVSKEKLLQTLEELEVDLEAATAALEEEIAAGEAGEPEDDGDDDEAEYEL